MPARNSYRFIAFPLFQKGSAAIFGRGPKSRFERQRHRRALEPRRLHDLQCAPIHTARRRRKRKPFPAGPRPCRATGPPIEIQAGAEQTKHRRLAPGLSPLSRLRLEVATCLNTSIGPRSSQGAEPVFVELLANLASATCIWQQRARIGLWCAVQQSSLRCTKSR